MVPTFPRMTMATRPPSFVIAGLAPSEPGHDTQGMLPSSLHYRPSLHPRAPPQSDYKHQERWRDYFLAAVPNPIAGYPELHRCEGRTAPRDNQPMLRHPAMRVFLMKRLPIVLSVAAMALVMHSGAFAQSGPKNGGVKINGFASNTTVANGNANVTSGLLNKGCQNIGYVGELDC
jgi:hypothetical protein